MTTVRVDVVDPAESRALILIEGTGHQARVGRVGPRRFYVEDTDTERTLDAEASSYSHAGRLFAIHHGIAGARVVVDYEEG